jgi:F-type H+-transporting ATPase subunit delta
MLQTSVALKYAKALFDSAREEGRLDAVGADMEALGGLEIEDPAFRDFLVSPEVLTEHKIEFVKAVFEPRVDRLTANFLRLLVEKARINHFKAICQEFERLYEEHQGKLRAQVMSAVSLSGHQEVRLKSELDRLTGKDVVLEKKVDPSVLGGVVVHLGNKIIDRSLRQGLKQMHENLTRVEVN